MATKRARLAVSALVSALSADLPAALRAIETEDGIAVNSLGDPTEIRGAFTPSDQRDRLVQVFADSGENDSEFGSGFSGTAITECVVVFSHTTSSADPSVGELLAWRWVDAICDVIAADPSLGGQVVKAVWTDFDRTYALTDESSTRHVRAVGVEVMTC